MAEKLAFSKILLIVDGTESGTRAARFATQFAALHRAKITAVATVDTITLKSLLKSSILAEAEMMEFDQELESSAQTHLNYVGQLCRENQSECELVLRKGAAHAVVSEESRKISPDLLIMGTFTSTMIKRDLNARARRLIVDEATCPILLIP